MADEVYVDHGVVEYAVNLVLATRDPAPVQPPRARRADRPSAPAPAPASASSPAARALALLRGRTYALPQDVFDVAPDVLRHRLVLSYEALAQGLAVDQMLARLLSTVPGPAGRPVRRTRPARPPRPRCRRRPPAAPTSPSRPRRRDRPARPLERGTGAARRARPTAPPDRRSQPTPRCARPDASDRPPEHRHRTLGRGAAPARADRHPPARRHAAGRLPRPGARPRLASRARPGPTTPATTSAASTGTSPPARSEPHIRETIADRELETWVLADLSASLALRHRRLREARPGPGRHGGRRLPHPAHRQPHRRRGRSRARTADHPARPRRSRQPAGPAAPGRCWPPRPTTRRLRPRRARSGAWPPPPAGAAWPSSCPTSSAPTSGNARCACSGARHEVLAVEVVDPRELELPDVGPARARGSRDRQRARGPDRQRQDPAAATPRPPPPSGPRSPARIRSAGADHLVLRTDHDWLLDLVRFVAWRRERLESLARLRRS